jgi:hypothetical protein
MAGIAVEDGDAGLDWADEDGPTGEPVVEIEPAARELFIWGRRPDDRGRIHSDLTQPQLARLQALLSGY